MPESNIELAGNKNIKTSEGITVWHGTAFLPSAGRRPLIRLRSLI